MTTSLQDIIETNEVTFHISTRIGNAIAHSRLSSQVHYHMERIASKSVVNQRLISNVSLHHNEVLKAFQLLQTFFLDTHIIVIVHIVNTDHADVFHFFQQFLGKITTNETRCTRYEYSFSC